MTAAEAFGEALRHDRLAQQMGVFDPAFERTCRETRWWLNEAARLEKVEADLTKIDAIELDAMKYAAKHAGDFASINKISAEEVRRLGF